MATVRLRKMLSDPHLLRGLAQYVSRKIPARDANDVAQATLADALAAEDEPETDTIERWLYGIARHKIADYYRRNRQHQPLDAEVPGAPSEISPESARDLLRWAKSELPRDADASRTLEWMLREAAGERLETIAEEHQIPAPTVRQRVSRMRRHLRNRWALQLAAAALGLFVVVMGYHWYATRHQVVAVPEPIPTQSPQERGEQLRRAALDHCQNARYVSCIEGLDRAKELDPLGDSQPGVAAARERATRMQAPAQAPSHGIPVPSGSASVPPAPSLRFPSPTPVSTASVPRTRADKVPRHSTKDSMVPSESSDSMGPSK